MSTTPPLKSRLSRRIVLFVSGVLLALHVANGDYLIRFLNAAADSDLAVAQAQTAALREHVGRLAGTIELALQDVGAGARTTDRAGLEARLQAAARRLPQPSAIVLVDAAGAVLGTSRTGFLPGPMSNIAAADVSDDLHVGTPQAIAGAAYVPVSRQLLNADGKPGGAAIAFIPPQAFLLDLSWSIPGQTTLVAMPDGAIVAGMLPGGQAAPAGRDAAQTLKSLPHAVTRLRAAEGLPLNVVIAQPAAWQSPAFRQRAWFDVVFMAFLTVTMVFLTLRLAREYGARESAEALFADAVNSAPAGVALYDANDRLILHNDLYARIFAPAGVRVADGKPFEELMHDARAEIHALDDEAAPGVSPERRLELHRSGAADFLQKIQGDDGARWILTRERRTAEGGVVAFHTDVTPMKRQEEALRESEGRERAARTAAEAADRAKTSFLATMSHELRTPLNAIIGFSEIIETRVFGDAVERYAAYAGSIRTSGLHLLAIINDILDLAKLRAGKTDLFLEETDLGEAVDEALGMVQAAARKKGIAAARETGPAGPVATVDKLRLRQILLNLLSNAVKFTPAGGRVDARIRADGTACAVEIADTGIGMKPEDIPAAMAPFSQIANAMTRNEEGTGLGLAIVKELIELHGGRFEIESALGKGTTVRVRLPLGGPIGSSA